MSLLGHKTASNDKRIKLSDGTAAAPAIVFSDGNGIFYDPIAQLIKGTVTFSPAAVPLLLGITIDNDEVEQGVSVGTLIGTFNPIGGTAPIVFSILVDADDKFEIGGAGLDELHVKNTFHYPTAQSHGVTVRATDVNAQTFDQAFTINLTVGAYTSVNCIRLNMAVTNQYLQNTSISGGPLDFSTAFTVSYWINCPVNTAFSHFAIGNSGSSYKVQVLNNGLGGSDARFFIQDSGGQTENLIVTGEPFWADNVWHHLCFTYSEDNPQIYVDGTAYTRSFFGNPDMAATLRTSVTSFFVGSRFPGPTSATNGKFDEMVLFDVALNASEVSELYNGGSQNFHPYSHSRFMDIVAWYRMEGLTGGVVVDQIGNADLSPVNVTGSDFVAV